MESENFSSQIPSKGIRKCINLTQEFELGLFLYLVNKIKWYLLLIIIIATSCGFIYLRYTPEIYSTSALIQVSIKDEPTEFSDFYSFKSRTNLNAELALFKSQKSINKVIEKLDLKIFYYSQGEVLTRFLYSSSPYNLVNYSIKNKSIKSLPIYINFDGKYFSLSDEKRKFIMQNILNQTNFFIRLYLRDDKDISKSEEFTKF